MKVLILSLLFSLPVWGQPLKPIHLKRGIFVPTKTMYRHVSFSSLPMRQGKVDTKRLLLASVGNNEKPALNQSQQRLYSSVVKLLLRKRPGRAKIAWEILVKSFANESTPRNLNALFASVLREAYLDRNKDLKIVTQKVKHNNDQKVAIREHIAEIRETCASGACGSYVRDYLRKLDSELNTLGEDGQLFNIDLQNALQRMQQTLQTMANVSKLLHDTAMAVIRKL